MAIAVRREQDVAVLEWTRRDVGKLADAVRQELKDGAKRLLLDLSGVDYLKGGGFETLTEVLSAANDAEAVIGMCNVDRGIGIIMNQLGLGPGFFASPIRCPRSPPGQGGRSAAPHRRAASSGGRPSAP